MPRNWIDEYEVQGDIENRNFYGAKFKNPDLEG